MVSPTDHMVVPREQKVVPRDSIVVPKENSVQNVKLELLLPELNAICNKSGCFDVIVKYCENELTYHNLNAKTCYANEKWICMVATEYT